MKKKTILGSVLLGMTMLALTACGAKTDADNQKTVTAADISAEHVQNSDALYWGYSYDELQEQADVIAKVQILDELSADNSVVNIGDNDMLESFCSVRNVKPLAFYKNTLNLDEQAEFLVQDDAAIYNNNGTYYLKTVNEQKPLVQGDTYILYLQKQDVAVDGALVIMSGYNGMVHLEDPQENQSHADIVEKTLEEYGSNS